MKKYTKDEAIENAKNFLKEVHELEKKYSVHFTSDTGDIRLSYQTIKGESFWGSVKIGWEGDGVSGLTVTEKNKEEKVKEALLKLTDEEKELLNLK